MSDDALTVGQTVARARVAAGLTPSQVADATRIRATLVTAIENDDYRLCGGDVYARGHLKSIATAVGLDPAEVVRHFDAERGSVRTAATLPHEPVVPVRAPAPPRGASLGTLAAPLGANVESGRRGGMNWTAVMATALALIVGVTLVSFLSNRGSSPVAQPTTSSSPSTSSTGSPTAEPSASAEVTPSSTPTDVVAEAPGVNVKLSVTGKASWVRVTGGTAGKTLFEGTMTKGETKTFTDDTLVKLVLGNAGAVSLKVNGRDLGAPGSGGQVVKTEFGPGDPTGSSG